MFGESSSEYRDPYAEKYGKDDFGDEEEEDGGIDAEDLAEDAMNALEEASDKVTSSQREDLEDAIDTLDTHYDKDPKEAKVLFDKIEDLIADMKACDEEELSEREDEFTDKINSLRKQALDLGK